jgi:hypothetical protein
MLWRRVDQPGHEAARLVYQPPFWHLMGAAVFAHEGQPCRLDYEVICNSVWETRSGRVSGWVGDALFEIEISVDTSRQWFLNGEECPQVEGCTDLDLNFSPSTNLLPIRRLGLSIGQAADMKAAWLRFPSFTLEPLEQRYTCVSDGIYRYESAGGEFTRELSVNAAGFVTHYPGFWQADGG